MSLANYLQINKWERPEKNFMYKVILISTLTGGIIAFSLSFQILYIFDTFSIALAGEFLMLFFLTTFILDYPTGNLSDRIGQRGVILLSLIFHLVGMFYLSLATMPNELYIIAIIEGIAGAQFSGTRETWLDNNYKYISEKYDKDYSIYGIFQVKLGVFNNISLIIFSIIGGYVAIVYSRSFALLIEAILSGLIIPIVLLFMTNLPEINKEIKKVSDSIWTNYKNGVKFLFSSKKLFLIIFSISLIITEGFLYIKLLMIPMYNAYTGNDFLISIAFNIEIFAMLITKLVFINKLMSYSKNIHKIYPFFIVAFFFESLIVILLVVIPFNNTFNLFGIGFLIIFAFLMDVIGTIGVTFLFRLLTINTPNELRNSIYSLSSSIGMLFLIIILPFSTFLLNNYSLPIAFIINLLITSFVTIMTIIIYQISKNEHNSY